MCMRVLLQGDFLIKDNTNFFFAEKGGSTRSVFILIYSIIG